MEVQTSAPGTIKVPAAKKARLAKPKSRARDGYVHTRGREPGPFTSKVIGLEKGKSFLETEVTRQVLSSLIYRASTTIFKGKRRFETVTEYDKKGDPKGIRIKRTK